MTLYHYTDLASWRKINASGRIGGRYGVFSLRAEQGYEPRLWQTLVKGARNEVAIDAAHGAVFARPPRTGLWNAVRWRGGVHAAPLGTIDMTEGFIAGEILRNGVFRPATAGEYAYQLGHQWILDDGVDTLLRQFPNAIRLLATPVTSDYFVGF